MILNKAICSGQNTC